MERFKIGDIEVAAKNLGQAKIAVEILQRRGVTQRTLKKEDIEKLLQDERDHWASSPNAAVQYAGTAVVERIARKLGLNEEER